MEPTAATQAATGRATATPGPSAKQAALRQALLDALADGGASVDIVRIREIVEAWHPEDTPGGDYGRGYARALANVAYAVARAAGIDTTPYLETP